jgi:hypothetical protein
MKSDTLLQKRFKALSCIDTLHILRCDFTRICAFLNHGETEANHTTYLVLEQYSLRLLSEVKGKGKFHSRTGQEGPEGE